MECSNKKWLRSEYGLYQANRSDIENVEVISEGSWGKHHKCTPGSKLNGLVLFNLVEGSGDFLYTLGNFLVEVANVSLQPYFLQLRSPRFHGEGRGSRGNTDAPPGEADKTA